MTTTDYTERPLRSAVGPVPEIDTTVASQTSCIKDPKVFGSMKVPASRGSLQDVCGELIGVVLSPPFISKAYLPWKTFRLPTDTDFRGNHTPYFAVGSEYIARSNATSSYKILNFSLQALPSASSYVSGFSCLFKK